jgi:hypothetical protein
LLPFRAGLEQNFASERDDTEFQTAKIQGLL